MDRATRTRTNLLVALALSLSACGGETIAVGGPPPAAPSTPTPTDTTAAAAPAPEAEPAAAVPALPTYRDEDFVEAENNRDPFRNYAVLFVPRTQTGPVRVQRRVLMDATTVDEIRLIAIISGVASPSAMLLDGQGTGHTVHRGDYVGRAEYVSTGGADSVPITLNWRVDRISPTEVVLSREDPSSPDQVGLTRVLPLHDATEG
jgi:type IV pilus assembly protein PilP